MGATAENLHDRFPQLTKEAADPKLIQLVQALNIDPKSAANKEKLEELSVRAAEAPDVAFRPDSWAAARRVSHGSPLPWRATN